MLFLCYTLCFNSVSCYFNSVAMHMFDGNARMHNSQQFVGGNKHLHECDLSSSETKGRKQCCVPAVVPDRDHHSSSVTKGRRQCCVPAVVPDWDHHSPFLLFSLYLFT